MHCLVVEAEREWLKSLLQVTRCSCCKFLLIPVVLSLLFWLKLIYGIPYIVHWTKFRIKFLYGLHLYFLYYVTEICSEFLLSLWPGSSCNSRSPYRFSTFFLLHFTLFLQGLTQELHLKSGPKTKLFKQLIGLNLTSFKILVLYIFNFYI